MLHLFISVTNPIDVIKIRLQLDNELSNQKNIFKDRKYKGFLGGGLLIAREEGMRGLYKGFVCQSFVAILQHLKNLNVINTVVNLSSAKSEMCIV